MKIYKAIELKLYNRLMEIHREQLKKPSALQETRLQSESVAINNNSEAGDTTQKGEGQPELWKSFDKLVEQIESDRGRRNRKKRATSVRGKNRGTVKSVKNRYNV